jgi:hypothetical protein
VALLLLGAGLTMWLRPVNNSTGHIDPVSAVRTAR